MDQLLASKIDPAFAAELADRHSVVPMEFANDVHRVHSDLARNLRKTERFVETRAEKFVNLSEPARWPGFALGAQCPTKLCRHLASQPFDRKRSHIVHILPLRVQRVREPLQDAGFQADGLAGKRTVLFDMAQPARGHFQIEAARTGGGNAVLVDHLRRTEKDGVSRTSQLPDRELLRESSRQYKTEAGLPVSVKVQMQPRLIESVGQC